MDIINLLSSYFSLLVCGLLLDSNLTTSSRIFPIASIFCLIVPFKLHNLATPLLVFTFPSSLYYKR